MLQNFSAHRAAVVLGDVLGGTAIILLIPVGILALGIPVVLVVRAVLWATGQL